MIKSLLIMAALFTPMAGIAQTSTFTTETVTETVVIDETSSSTTQQSTASATTTVSTDSQSTDGFTHFTWGADIGSSIDMTGQDLTAFDLTASFGYKGSYIRFAGIGAGIKMMVSNSSHAYPVYALFRSSFTRQPSFCFMEMKAGVSFMNIRSTGDRSAFYGSLGIGFTLAKGRNFSSHIILAYEYTPLSSNETMKFQDMQYATIRIGASF